MGIRVTKGIRAQPGPQDQTGIKGIRVTMGIRAQPDPPDHKVQQVLTVPAA